MSLNNVKYILLVLSGKGGVGKSSLTTQLALSLTLSGKSVGILDIDLTGPSIPRLLGLENAKITQAPGGWLPVSVHDAQKLPALGLNHIPPGGEGAAPTAEQQDNGADSSNGRANDGRQAAAAAGEVEVGALHAISLGFLLPTRDSAVIWRGPKKTAMVRQFLTDVLWPPQLDYLLIDTPPGTSDEHISVAETLLRNSIPAPPPPPPPTTTTTAASRPSGLSPLLAGAVVVTTPQAVATADVRKEINFCRKTGIPIVGVVENLSGFVCECCGEKAALFGEGGGRAMAREFGERFLGTVPVDLGWGVVVEEGRWAGYRRVEREEEEEDSTEGDGEEVEGQGLGKGEVKEEEQVEGQNGREDDGRARRKPQALLVQRYRSCKLCDVLEGITKQVIELVEGGHHATS